MVKVWDIHAMWTETFMQLLTPCNLWSWNLSLVQPVISPWDLKQTQFESLVRSASVVHGNASERFIFHSPFKEHHYSFVERGPELGLHLCLLWYKPHEAGFSPQCRLPYCCYVFHTWDVNSSLVCPLQEIYLRKDEVLVHHRADCFACAEECGEPVITEWGTAILCHVSGTSDHIVREKHDVATVLDHANETTE